MTRTFEEIPFETLQLIVKETGEPVDPTVGMKDGEGFYGFQDKKYGRPEQLAPRSEEAGGFLFLPGKVSDSMLEQLVGVAGMASTERYTQNQFGVQEIVAPEGTESELGYLRKIVIADRFALMYLFGAIDNHTYKNFPQQPADVADCVKSFVESERQRYGTLFGNPGLAGKFGGNGNYSQEALGFGFAIENSYYRIISVWSRGWLCTK